MSTDYDAQVAADHEGRYGQQSPEATRAVSRRQLTEQRLSLFQVARIKPFSKTTHRPERVAREPRPACPDRARDARMLIAARSSMAGPFGSGKYIRRH
jgi:hypothetical protein